METICKKCGAPLEANAKFCTTCGEKVKPPAETGVKTAAENASQAVLAAGPAAADAKHLQAAAGAQPLSVKPPEQPAAVPPGDVRPPRGSKYAPISTLGYIGYMFVMCLPVIGLIMTVIWAFTGEKVNRVHLARAVLFFTIICIILSVAAAVMFWPQISQYMRYALIAFGA